MKELTYDQAVEFLQQAVEEKGENYVYPKKVEPEEYDEEFQSCVYFDQGAPSCIVGHVLYYMGYDHVVYEGPLARAALAQLGIMADAKAADLLVRVQEKQDEGIPWGEALLMATTP